MNINQEVLLGLAKSAARKAGTYILSEFQSHHEFKVKDETMSQASQVVTEVDVKAQEIILKELKIRDYLDIGMLSEELEFDNSRFEKPFFWCIDPMDGTLPFIEGKSGFSVAIALVSREGVPELSVIYDPLNDNLYHAVKGKGAYLNGELFIVPEPKGDYTLFCDRSLLNTKELEEIKSQIALENGLNIQVVSKSGAVMNALSVVSNPPAAYIKPTKKQKGGGGLWDFVSTVLFFRELGLSPFKFNNQELDLNPKDSVYFNQQGIRYRS